MKNWWNRRCEFELRIGNYGIQVYWVNGTLVAAIAFVAAVMLLKAAV